MLSDNAIYRLIFGFKVRYLRQQQNLSYQQLSQETGLSKSYLNDIEKGKKYPKPDKVQALSRALGVEYDTLVSMGGDKKLQPIIDLLQSSFFKLFPLQEFGISPEKLLEVFMNAPDRVNAFIGTIFKLGRHYQIGEEQFYQVALRSFQDMHNNYFPKLETAAQDFLLECLPAGNAEVVDLERILEEKYQILVQRMELPQSNKAPRIRSYFQTRNRCLYLNKDLVPAQERFLLARELGFQYLQLKERPYETRILQGDSFEKLLNNFRVSYFAAALLMPEKKLVKDLRLIARESNWRPELFTNLLTTYHVTQEMLLQRLTNLLPHHFGIEDLFFIRLQTTENLQAFHMTKELHLAQMQSPYNNELLEHYCRRWVSIGVLRSLAEQQALSSKVQEIASAQLSEYWGQDKSYFCLSMAKSSHQGRASVTLGLLINPHLRSVFNFLSDPDLPTKTVGTTCERCAVSNCGARVRPPLILEKEQRLEQLQEQLEKL